MTKLIFACAIVTLIACSGSEEPTLTPEQFASNLFQRGEARRGEPLEACELLREKGLELQIYMSGIHRGAAEGGGIPADLLAVEERRVENLRSAILILCPDNFGWIKESVVFVAE